MRTLSRDLAFTSLAVVTLALGIGANTAIFSVVNAVLLSPLPYNEPDRLVLLQGAPLFLPDEGVASRVLPPPAEWLNWRERLRSFEYIAAVNGASVGVNVTGDGEPERIEATEVTTNFFDAMGTRTVRGRGFHSDDEQPGASAVAIISYGLWQRRFGGSNEVVGSSITLNDRPFTIIGVAPSELQYPVKVDLWMPVIMGKDRVLSGSVMFFNIIGRMRPGVALEEARADTRLFSEWYGERFVEDRSKFTPVEIIPLAQQLVKGIRPALLLLLGAVALVLLIACANVANLMFARALSRRREMAIRAALGASRWRIVSQLLSESLLLAFAGGAAGLILAFWGVDWLLALSPGALPRLEEIVIDSQVLGFTLLLSLSTGIVFGLLPALQGSKFNLTEAMKESTPHTGAGRRVNRTRGILVSAEIGLAVVLMIGAGLMLRSFMQLVAVNPGFEAGKAMTVSMSLPTARYDTAEKRTLFFEQLIERLRTVPGVDSVGVTNVAPLDDTGLAGFSYGVESTSSSSDGEDRFAVYFLAGGDYFRSLGIRLLEGRSFTEHDRRGATPVVIINEALARRHWPNESAVGKRITLSIEDTPREIVGVIAMVKSYTLKEDGAAETYVPYDQTRFSPRVLTIRADLDTQSLVTAVRREVAALDPNLPIYDVKTMAERVSATLAKERFMLTTLGVFACVALLLATVGVYGLMLQSVTQRTHEIGIRMALGAGSGDVLRFVMKQGALLTATGTAGGALASIWLTGLMESLLFGVSTTDARTFMTVPVLLAGVALLACYFPARRASRVDPMVALRYE